jgi:hypothetical protein
MFDPNDVFVSILGSERLTYLGINLELYNNFSFREKLHINVVYNGEKDLTKLEDKYDSLNILSENKGYQARALDLINASLKNFIDSEKNIGVMHNFDYLFFYDNAFEIMITDLLRSGKSLLGWRDKNIQPPQKAVYETDCFVITKELAKRLYPIVPEKNKPIFYRTALYIGSADEDGAEVMKEWFFRKLVNVIMYEGIGELNNRRYLGAMPQKHIARDHNKVLSALDKYCFFIQTTSEEYYATSEEQEEDGDDCFFFSCKDYDSKYQCIHTNSTAILKPLLTLFRYNVHNKKLETIDRFINNEVLLGE